MSVVSDAGSAPAAGASSGWTRMPLTVRHGADLPGLSAMRDLLRRTPTARPHEPDLGLDWDAAERRLGHR